MAANPNTANQYVEISESSALISKQNAASIDATPQNTNLGIEQIVEILVDGSEEPLKRAGLTEEQKKLLFSILLIVLLAQASCFSAFQILNILKVRMQGSASEKEQLIAVWSALILLAIAAGTVFSETVIRGIHWWFSETKEVPANRLLLLIDLFKSLTVSLFCASFYLEEIRTFNPAVAKTGGVFFAILVGSESVVDAAISGCTPSEKYLSTTFFIDGIQKALICVAAVMQLYPETALAGFIMAAMLFASVAMNVVLIWLNDRADVEYASLQPTRLQDANIQGQGYVTVDSAHNNSAELFPNLESSDRTPLRTKEVQVSRSKSGFWHLCQEVGEGLSARASNVPGYVCGMGSKR